MIGALLSTAAVSGALAALVEKQARVDKVARPYAGNIKASAARYKVGANILIGVLWQESRFDPNAVGSSGEIGMAQFMPIAAEDIGVELEDLKNPAMAIEAAAKLLALNRGRLAGNMWDSIRAYNVGVGKAAQDKTAGSGYALDVMATAAGRATVELLGLV